MSRFGVLPCSWRFSDGTVTSWREPTLQAYRSRARAGCQASQVPRSLKAGERKWHDDEKSSCLYRRSSSRSINS
jgi:hypothetical protein